MCAYAYPAAMRTIEEIRLDNFRALVAELERDLNRKPLNVEISAHLGVICARNGLPEIIPRIN